MNKPQSEEKKQESRLAIVKLAADLFLADGIDAVTMEIIAKKRGIGVATLYRCFKVKKSLVIASGILLWEKAERVFVQLDSECRKEKLSGFQAYDKLLSGFLELYQNQKSFFLFLRQFDSFCLKEKVSQGELKDYEKTVLSVRSLFFFWGQVGLEDGSIRPGIDLKAAYYAFSKAIIGLSQKLIGENKILSSDEEEDGRKQVEVLLDAFKNYLRR